MGEITFEMRFDLQNSFCPYNMYGGSKRDKQL